MKVVIGLKDDDAADDGGLQFAVVGDGEDLVAGLEGLDGFGGVVGCEDGCVFEETAATAATGEHGGEEEEDDG